jgi:hypothetical protein
MIECAKIERKIKGRARGLRPKKMEGERREGAEGQ